jgi:hypothetical protein
MPENTASFWQPLLQHCRIRRSLRNCRYSIDGRQRQAPDVYPSTQLFQLAPLAGELPEA